MTKSTQENWIWRALFILAAAGMIFMAFVSLSGGTFFFKENHNVLNYFVTFGISLLISGACFCFGGLAGFLFGIPRIINSTSPERPKSTVMQNDNLVQISDWLTKILVGVGLTQLYEIPGLLRKIGNFLAPCFSYTNTGSAIAISLVLYFLILGFMASYLWTRFYFSEMLEDAINDDDGGPKNGTVNNTTVTINPPTGNIQTAVSATNAANVPAGASVSPPVSDFPITNSDTNPANGGSSNIPVDTDPMAGAGSPSVPVDTDPAIDPASSEIAPGTDPAADTTETDPSADSGSDLGAADIYPEIQSSPPISWNSPNA